MVHLKKALTFTVLLLLVFSCLATTAFAVDTRAGVGVYVDGKAFSGNIQVKNNDTFVGIRKFSTSMDPSAKVTYTSYNRTLTVESHNLYLVAKDGQNYVIANGRYLYTPTPVYMKNGVMYAPVSIMARSFGAKYSWDGASSSYKITRGSGGIVSGDKFYREDEVYWLSKIIYAESGGEPLLGKIAVGNVILNRARHYYFPNTIYGVIFDKQNGVQFSPTANGTIYKTPNSDSVIAAKICLEGYSVDTSILYFVNASVVPNSWVVKNRPLYAKIGNHSFYY